MRATNCFGLRKEVENVKITARQAKTTSKLNKSLGVTVYKTFFFLIKSMFGQMLSVWEDIKQKEGNV